MTHLVRKRKLAVESVLVVQKHIGMRRSAGRICAAALALVLVYIYPAVFKALTKHRQILLAERSKSLEHVLLRLLERYLLVAVAHNRRVQVIHMQLVYAHKLFAQAHILMHLVHVFVDSLYKIMIYARRNLRPVERRLHGACIFARVCIEHELLYLRVEYCGGRVLI